MMGAITPVMLHEFIASHRDEIISRCRAKVRARSDPPPTRTEIDHGVPLFLEQLVDALRLGMSSSPQIGMSAILHGHDLLMQGFTVGQVVHDYGDVCQSITDLAVELDAPISTADFRTLNRCLDDAIAAAVTEHARDHELTRDGESYELRHSINIAMIAFEMIKSGNVGIRGSTGAMLYRSLKAISAFADHQAAASVPR